jgi:hypothetical protein
MLVDEHGAVGRCIRLLKWDSLVEGAATGRFVSIDPRSKCAKWPLPERRMHDLTERLRVGDLNVLVASTSVPLVKLIYQRDPIRSEIEWLLEFFEHRLAADDAADEYCILCRKAGLVIDGGKLRGWFSAHGASSPCTIFVGSTLLVPLGVNPPRSRNSWLILSRLACSPEPLKCR